MTIRVFQGEREMAADNKMLGQFDLVGIPPAPRGVPQIEVTFDIDANGIVNVSAKDKGTGKEQQIRIQASGGLSDNDIEQMVRDAEQFAEEDKKRRAAAEAKNNVESLIHTTERQLADNGDKVDDGLKGEIQSAIDDAKKAVEGNDPDQMNERAQALAQVAMKLGQAIYDKQGAGRAQPAGRRRDQGGRQCGRRRILRSRRQVRRPSPSPRQGRGPGRGGVCGMPGRCSPLPTLFPEGERVLA